MIESDQTTTVTVTCSNGRPNNVGLDAGSVTGSTVANGLLGGTGTPTPTVAFQLYRDSARSLVWGQTGATDTQSGTGAVPSSCSTLSAPASAMPFTVNATVINDCTLSATDINFGTAGVLNGTLTATGTRRSPARTTIPIRLPCRRGRALAQASRTGA